MNGKKESFLPENYYTCKKFNEQEEWCDCDSCKKEREKDSDGENLRLESTPVTQGKEASIDSKPSEPEKIDKSEWKTNYPKLFEYDRKNNIVDVFVKKDPQCPFPFHEENWWHQGFYLGDFLVYLKLFFERHDLPYKIVVI